MIPLLKPSVTQAEIDEVTDTLKSGWWGLGPKTEKFEREFASYVGVPHAVAVNSATAALHLALEALELPPGEIIVPAITFASTAWAVVYAGHRPVFADVDPETLALSPATAAARITPQTRAIIPVHYAGRPVDLEGIEALGFPVIEDCAHACGARYKQAAVGTRNVGCFSFHAVKNLATGDGGMITTTRSDLARKLVPLRWVGIDKSTWNRAETRYGWDYEINSKGYKAHMNDITASLGLAQLRRLDQMNARRREIAEVYRRELSPLGWIQMLPPSDAVYASAWHCFPIRVPNRDELVNFLLEKGISAGVHYRPLYHHPAFQNFGNPAELPHTEREWLRLVTIPLYPDLQENEVALIIDTLRKFPLRKESTEWQTAPA